ncbi:MAG: hypothetical protein PHV49_05195 [Alistipes sp.]|nr:hypothetical protein [Alistipes sp.]
MYYSSVEGVNIANAQIYSAELPRKTGAIALNIMDSANAPSNFAGLRLNFTYPEFWGITVNAGYQSGSKSITFPGTAFSFPEVFINTWPFVEQQITLEVLTTGNNVLKTIKVNAPVYENKKTVITGELFGGSQSFTVSINDSWGEDNIVNFE